MLYLDSFADFCPLHIHSCPLYPDQHLATPPGPHYYPV